MTPSGINPPKRRKRKWLRRALVTAAVVAAAALAAPFVFTGTLVRYYLAHSDYRHVSVRFRSATLSFMGRLTLQGLEIDEPGEAGHKLLSADKVQVAFSWTALSSKHFESLVLENLDVALHPGPDAPATLLGLLTPAPPAPGLIE